MKKTGFLVCMLVCGFWLNAQDAASIVTTSRNRIQADTVSTRSRMEIRARNGQVTERVIDQYEKDGNAGNRTVIVFQSPASVAGTRFLTMENPGNADDRWIFLPSLGRVRRIAASEGSSSFMGTDLSYDDISSMNRDVNLDTHRVLREEVLNGNPCFVIESVPRDNSYQYSRMVQWINRNNHVMHKVELYDRRGGSLAKVLEILELRDIQGRLSAVRSRMSTISAGTSTTIFADILRYDDPIPESVFTLAFLETGRP